MEKDILNYQFEFSIFKKYFIKLIFVYKTNNASSYQFALRTNAN